MALKTLSALRSIVAGYHEKATADMTVNGVDLFLFAVNNAITDAQMLHNFEDCRASATLTIDAIVGGDLSAATFEQNGGGGVTTVVGTGSGIIDGDYIQTGSLNGYPLFILAATTSGYIYYHAGLQSYILSTSINTTTPAVYWMPTAQNTVPGTYPHHGGASGTAIVSQDSTGTFSGVREVLAVMRQRPDGTYIPLDFARADIPIERDRTELEFSDNLFPYLRYPSDAQINARGTNSSVIQRAGTLHIYPRYTTGVTTPFEVLLECFAWLRDLDSTNYSDTGPSNFFLQYGFSWLQWSCIIELNHLFKAFTPRVEGNLGPPEKMRDMAWEKLVLFDNHRVDSNTTRSR